MYGFPLLVTRTLRDTHARTRAHTHTQSSIKRPTFGYYCFSRPYLAGYNKYISPSTNIHPAKQVKNKPAGKLWLATLHRTLTLLRL